MNLCKQTLSKLNLSYRNVFTNAIRPFSAVTNEEIRQEDEPDKLYKNLELELRGNDPAVLRSYATFSTTAASHLNVEGKSWAQRKPQHDRLTFSHLTGSTGDTLLEYLERNLPEGVALKATKVELQKIPEHFTPSQ